MLIGRFDHRYISLVDADKYLKLIGCLLQETAHEICSLVGQCFQIVYTEATMQAFDKNLEHNGTYSSQPGSTGMSHESCLFILK